MTGILFEPAEQDVVKVTWESPKYKTCINNFYLKWATVACIKEMGTKTKTVLLGDAIASDENADGK